MKYRLVLARPSLPAGAAPSQRAIDVLLAVGAFVALVIAACVVTP